MSAGKNENEILRGLFALSSFANILGGLALLLMVAMGITAYPEHPFPPVAIAVGIVLLVQGIYSASYTQHWWTGWEDIARGALFASQWVALGFAAATLVYAVFYNARASNGGVEPAPVLAGAMIGANALLALVLLGTSGALTPKTRGSAGL